MKHVGKAFLKALVVLGLGWFGLITFGGGLISALIVGALITGLSIFLVDVLFPLLITGGAFAEFFGALLGGALGVLLVTFVIETLIYALALWILSCFLPIVFVGFWATMLASAILAAVSNLLSHC
jgi:hypothetical protein